MPIVGIDTLSLVMSLDEGTPLSFEVVHEKICVSCHFMDESRLDVIVGMSKGAELLIVTDVALVSTKFGLIFFDVV